MKTKTKPQTTLQINHHFVEAMQMRFAKIKMEQVNDIINMSKRFTPADLNRRHIPYPVLVNKLRNPNYHNSVYYVNEKLNAIFVSVDNKMLVNALFLDGKDGYANLYSQF